MEAFPQLKDTQVALIRADTLTGHVLDEKLELAINDTQAVFTIFDNVDIALSFARSIILQHNTIECVIYGKNEEVVHHVTTTNLES